MNSTVYLKLFQPIEERPAGFLLRAYIAESFGLDVMKMPFYTNAASAKIPGAELYLTPEWLAFWTDVPSTPIDAIRKALSIANQLKKSNGIRLEFDPTNIAFGVMGMDSRDASSLGAFLQKKLYRGGPFTRDDFTIGLGTGDGMNNTSAVKISNSGIAEPAETLDILLARIQAT